MFKRLHFKEHLLVFNVYFTIISLLSLDTSVYAEAKNMRFTAEAKPANKDLYNVILDCYVDDTPNSLALYKKSQPKNLELYKQFNPNKTAYLLVKFEWKHKTINDINGEYECDAIFSHKPRLPKIVKINKHDLQPTFCEMTTNDQIINVSGNKAVANFCVASEREIEKVSLDGQILFDKRVMASDKYKLEINKKDFKTEFRLHLLQVTRSSARKHKVKIVYATNSSLEYQFSLLFPKENPILCDDTSNNTIIPTVTNMATVRLCVKPGDNISMITINNVQVFNNQVLPSTQYKIHNETDGDKINFTIQMLNLTTASPEKNVVKILTNHGLQLTYLVNVKYNPVSQISADCFTTKNDTSQHVVNNAITLLMCVNKPQPTAKVSVNGLSIDGGLSQQSARYSVKNETRGDSIQLTIEISNLNRKSAQNVLIDLTSTEENKTFSFDLAFPPESSYSASSSTQQLPMFVSLIGVLVLTLCRH